MTQFLGAVTRAAPLALVCELMRGGSLAEALDARGGAPVPLGRAVVWAQDTAKGMRYLHGARRRALRPRRGLRSLFYLYLSFSLAVPCPPLFLFVVCV